MSSWHWFWSEERNQLNNYSDFRVQSRTSRDDEGLTIPLQQMKTKYIRKQGRQSKLHALTQSVVTVDRDGPI